MVPVVCGTVVVWFTGAPTAAGLAGGVLPERGIWDDGTDPVIGYGFAGSAWAVCGYGLVAPAAVDRGTGGCWPAVPLADAVGVSP